ncbi:hypothetical protein, partial [Agrobacterium sp. NPDC089420]|uniref:hypothetical protein n=1 Tax=Agrobacterium sp. NPDC089420 TaxID=3363918 RepID=UPI00384DF398
TARHRKRHSQGQNHIQNILRIISTNTVASAIKSLIAKDSSHGADAPWLNAGSSSDLFRGPA